MMFIDTMSKMMNSFQINSLELTEWYKISLLVHTARCFTGHEEMVKYDTD